MKRSLIIVAVVLGVLFAMPLTNNSVLAADYSGKYYVILGGEPVWTMLIHQSGNNVTFTLAGTGVAVSGAGNVSGNTMTLTATLDSTVSILATFSNDGQNFSGSYNVTGDGSLNGSITGTKRKWDTYNVNTRGIPKFVSMDYIDLAKISRISKFRSGAGHDFPDDFERCRNMKHYFNPKSNVNWSTIKTLSPVNGTYIGFNNESAGKAIGIQSKDFPAFTIMMYHVKLTRPLNIGSTVIAGQVLGTHIGPQAVSDIAVWVHTPNGNKLLSYFDVMTDALFQNYQARGLSSRNEAIISKQARDASPLTCNGDEFVDPGKLGNWVNLSGDRNMDIGDISMITPYVNELDMAEIDPAYSETTSAPWGFKHSGLDLYPTRNLKPFRAVASGVVDEIDFSLTGGSTNWQVTVIIKYNSTYSQYYGFEPMSPKQADGRIQLANITVSVGQTISQGDIIGYLLTSRGGAHVHFGLFKYVPNGGDPVICPEPYFIPKARNSILKLLRVAWPGAKMCY